MADYWVSRKKWTCKYCDITINDDLPSRQQHEGGFRHKNNVERALKDIYRKSEQDKRDKEHARREMLKIERLAKEAHQGDLDRQSGSPAAPVTSQEQFADAGPSVDPSSSAPSSSTKAAPASSKTWKPSDQLSAYGSAAADEARRLAAEEEEAARKAAEVEEEARKQGIAGDWQSVAEPTPSGSYLREDGPQSDRDRARAFRVREKVAPSYLDGGADEDGPLSAIKVKKRIKVEASAETEEEQRRRMLPQWTSMSLNRGGSAVKQEAKKEEEAEEKPSVPPPSLSEPFEPVGEGFAPKAEDRDTVGRSEEAGPVPPTTANETTNGDGGETATTAPATTVKDETTEEKSGGGGGMFRKRKAGAGAGSKKVRMF